MSSSAKSLPMATPPTSRSTSVAVALPPEFQTPFTSFQSQLNGPEMAAATSVPLISIRRSDGGAPMYQTEKT